MWKWNNCSNFTSGQVFTFVWQSQNFTLSFILREKKREKQKGITRARKQEISREKAYKKETVLILTTKERKRNCSHEKKKVGERIEGEGKEVDEGRNDVFLLEEIIRKMKMDTTKNVEVIIHRGRCKRKREREIKEKE